MADDPAADDFFKQLVRYAEPPRHDYWSTRRACIVELTGGPNGTLEPPSWDRDEAYNDARIAVALNYSPDKWRHELSQQDKLALMEDWLNRGATTPATDAPDKKPPATGANQQGEGDAIPKLPQRCYLSLKAMLLENAVSADKSMTAVQIALKAEGKAANPVQKTPLDTQKERLHGLEKGHRWRMLVNGEGHRSGQEALNGAQKVRAR